MKKVKVLIEKGSEGTFGAYMLEDNGLEWGIHGDRDTVAEAEFSFAYDIPSFLLYYGDMLSYKGLAKLTGISAAQLSQYISGYRKPSAKTTEKIQSGLHGLGKELSQIQLI